MKGVRFCFDRLSLSVVFAICLTLVAATIVSAQPRTEYRGFWVDTFNTTLNNHADVVATVNNAKAAKANVIFAQVRRRGDSWYLNSLEPGPDFVDIAPGFDPLADLIATAHADGIEVHAFVIMSAIWSKNPTFAPSATLGPPVSNQHVFNQHAWNRATNSMRTGSDNWLTRSLAPFPSGVTFDGQRYGNDFWLDFGHPDAAAYTVDVLMHLVNNYNIDGLHLDRIRYPEFSVPAGQPAQTPANGTNVGYNSTSVARFNARHNRSGNPTYGDVLWKQWRRDQVSNVVRRVYLNAIAVKPNLKISGAFIATGNGPICNPGANCKTIWETNIRPEAYWRVYQDWRSWTEEGIIDIAIPMNYKREHLASQAVMTDEWNEWSKNHRYNRAVMIGLGNYLNTVEGNLRQVRRSLAPSAQGNRADGVNFFSMATTNAVATNGANTTPIVNPFAIPPSITPVRSFADFASSLVTGASADGQTRYEDAVANPVGIFAEPAAIPVHSWKVAPTKGHLKGFARRADNTILDTATVTITNIATNAARAGATDGGGFYGGVDLDPGQYLVKAELGADTVYSCVSNVSAGVVTTSDLAPETIAPVTTPGLSPAAPNGANGWYVGAPTLTLSAADGCSGVARTEYSLDNGTTWLPYSASLVISQEGTTTVLFRSVDRAGNIETAGSQTFMVDLSDPTAQLSANPSTIWPPNGLMTPVSISGTGADAVSGLSQVSYVVTDEYGSTVTIGTRSLTGNSANWVESILLEARRNGDDLGGRRYTIVGTVTDVAGRTTTSTTTVVVLHDQRRSN